MNPKLGVQWSILWKPTLPEGETFESMVAHAAANGIQIVSLRWGAGDHGSWQPWGEVRPGEFWYGGPVKRDRNGDIVTPLYAKDEPAPADAPMRQVFDLCAEHGLKIKLSLSYWGCFHQWWKWHPYNRYRLNARGNPCKLGQPGWLTSEQRFFTDRRSIDAYKDHATALAISFGGHPALWCVDIGCEFAFAANKYEAVEDFFPWVEEVSGHLWRSLPGGDADKPFLSISQMKPPADWPGNRISHALACPPDKVMLDWHRYGGAHTLADIRDCVYAWLDEYPEATLRIGEDWPWNEGPRPVPDDVRDVNIPEEAYEHDGVFRPMSLPPYPQERMLVCLLNAIPRTADFSRWWDYVDGTGGFKLTVKLLAEMLAPLRDLVETAALGDDAVRWEVKGDVAFKAAALALWTGCLSFVLVGQGVQTIDFGVFGDWRLVTWDWTNGERVADGWAVDASAVELDFSRYERGFCAGCLLGGVVPPEPPLPPEPPEPPAPPEPPTPPEPARLMLVVEGEQGGGRVELVRGREYRLRVD